MRRQIVRSSTRRIPLSPDEIDAGADKRDTYLDRLLMLIPAETVAVYLFLDGILRSALATEPKKLCIWLWSVFGVITIGNWLYLKRTAGISDRVQLSIMTAAYFVWVFTIGGPFALSSWYQPFMGSVFLVLYTFIAPRFYEGVVSPK